MENFWDYRQASEILFRRIEGGGGVGISNSNIPELINSLSKYRSNDGGDSGKETLAASIARLI